MSSLSRRRAALIGIGGISLASAGFLAPGAYAANTIDGDVKVSNTETVEVLMSSSGGIDAQRIYEQLVLSGKGKVDIANPVSTDKLRNLDGFGGFDVRDGKARVKTSVDGTKKFRSVSNFTKKLPIDIKITYTLDGKKIDPSDVVGKSGDLEVRYVVTNTTGTSQDVEFQDGKGKTQSEKENVVIPMVGTLTTTLPSSFTKVKSDGANGAGDGHGGTLLSYTMTLIPPIGKATAEFGYKAHVKDAVIPSAEVSALPVNPLENTSFKGGAESYKGGAETGQDLTAGATTIDANLLKIRDGASDLVNGILQLSEGANKLSAGLNNDAAPGAKKLAAGADDLNAGAKTLKRGLGTAAGGSVALPAGLGAIADGAAELSKKLGAVKAGADKMSAGVGTPSDATKDTLLGGVNLIRGGLLSQVVPGLNQILDGAAVTKGQLGCVADILNDFADPGEPAVKEACFTGMQGLPAPAAQMPALIHAQTEANPLIAGVLKKLATQINSNVANQDLENGVNLLKTAIATQFVPGLVGIGCGLDSTYSPGCPATDKDGETFKGLKQGLAEISGGVGTGSKKEHDENGKATTLRAGANDLSAGAKLAKRGASDLVSGLGKLNAGAGQLSDGTGQLSAGAGQLSDGLGTAASGSGQLAAGLDKAAKSAPALPKGASKLSREGTSQIVGKGNKTAMDFGLRYALLEAGAAKAANAQPYGSPEGATALTAYKFQIAGEDGADSANLKRGLAAIALLVAAGAFATVRRRGLI
jgi:putative membrane protein